jgi:predicted AAA+ superfamily ATPase
MNVYAFSVKRQQIAAKKIYSIDTGLINAIGFSFSPNTGKLMENAAFLALRRKTHEIYYYTTPAGYEVDFYLPESGQLVQVAQSMDNPATREREIRALADGMSALGLSSGLILTDSNSETMTKNGFTITIRCLAEWLLESE